MALLHEEEDDPNQNIQIKEGIRFRGQILIGT